MDGPLGRGFDSPHLQKTEIQPCVGSLFLFVGKGSRNEASGKSRAGAGFCSEGGFLRTTSSKKRLPPPPYCRSVFATIAHNRTTFLLFAVYKQVTQHSKFAKSNHCSYSSRFSKPFSDISRRCKELSFRETFQYSEKCLKVPKRISLFRVEFQIICFYLVLLFSGCPQ